MAAGCSYSQGTGTVTRVRLILTLALFAFFITMPMYRVPAAAGHDSFAHIPNAYEYADALEAGIVVDHIVLSHYAGLGGPNFKYYPPYSYLPVALLVLAGVSIDKAFAVAISLTFLISGLGMYAWARLHGARAASVICALLYMVTPYHLDDVYWRFAYPELWGFALAPWIFWGAATAARSSRPWRLLLVSLLLTAVGLLHNLSAFMIVPFLVVYWLWQTGLNVRSTARLAFVLLLAAALGAFYSLPAFLDRDQILMSRQFQDSQEFVDHALGLRELVHVGVASEKWVATPGLFFLLLGAWGCAAWLAHAPGRSRVKALCVPVLALVALLLCTEIGASLAFVIPPLKYLQFPWRFLLLVSLFLSLACGALFVRSVRPLRIAVATVLMSASVVGAVVANPLVGWDPPDRKSYRLVMAGIDWSADKENKYCPIWVVAARKSRARMDLKRPIWMIEGKGEVQLEENTFETIRLFAHTTSRE